MNMLIFAIIPILTISENPIRPIVNMLDKVYKEVELEYENEEKAHKKFMCYCDKNRASTESSLKQGDEMKSALQGSIEEKVGQLASLKEELSQLNEDLSTSQTSLNDARSVREKGEEEFQSEKADLTANIEALKKAIPALESKLGNPSAATSFLTRLAQSNKHVQSVFLTSKSKSPSSILGMLKQMQDDLSKDLATAIENNKRAIQEFNDLEATKLEEIQNLKNEILNKKSRSADVEKSHTKDVEDLEDASIASENHAKFGEQLGKNCATAEEDSKKVQADRINELKAIKETIKILNNDDSLDLFNKTLKKEKKSSFLSKLAKLMNTRNNDHVSFLQTESRQQQPIKKSSQDIPVQSIVDILSENAKSIHQQLKEDQDQKAHCDAETTRYQSEIEKGEKELKQLNSQKENQEEQIANLKESIENTKNDIKKTEDTMAEETNNRKEENDLFKKEETERQNTRVLLKKAIAKLSEFYGVEGDVEEFQQNKPASSFLSQSPLDPPKRRDVQHERKNQASFNVITLLNDLIKKVDAESTDAHREEEEGLKNFNMSIADHQKSIEDLQSKQSNDEKNLAETEEKLIATNESIDSTEDSTEAAKKQLSTLKDACEPIVNNFEQRTNDWKQELANIDKAKKIIRGAV